jgi:hypothetical protein
MTKKEVRLTISGKQRPVIDVDLMTQVVIALGRELAAAMRSARQPKPIKTQGDAA